MTTHNSQKESSHLESEIHVKFLSSLELERKKQELTLGVWKVKLYTNKKEKTKLPVYGFVTKDDENIFMTKRYKSFETAIKDLEARINASQVPYDESLYDQERIDEIGTIVLPRRNPQFSIRERRRFRHSK